MEQHIAKIRPRARVLDVLGDQLIRHARLAVFELVKNAFDADSPSAVVEFLNIQDPEKACIRVRDTGSGMDLQTITGIWLEPAADHRAIQRDLGKRTPIFHRLPVGEKGVGRFAVQKLGRVLRMVTRTKGGHEYEVRIDWAALGRSAYLEDVEIEVVERVPAEFAGDKHGTLIEITGLKEIEQWTRGEVRRLHRTVNAMVSPFDNRGDFSVSLSFDPDPGWLEGLFSARDALDAALFHFDFVLDESGIEWTYRYTPYDGLQADFHSVAPRTERREKNKEFEFFSHQRPPDETPWKKRPKRPKEQADLLSGIGPVIGQFFLFYLPRNIKGYLLDQQGISSFLREQAGVRVYRDGMRVFDYGESGNDWLGLDIQRVNNPTETLGNNLIVGEVLLDLAASSGLHEKTNREGFFENSAFREFRYAVQCALNEFKVQRNIDVSTLKQAFRAKEDPQGARINSPEEAIGALRKKILEANLAPEFGAYVDRIQRAYENSRDVLMSAVGAGMGLAVVFHEMERGVRYLERLISKGEEVVKLAPLAKQLVEMLEGAAYLVRKSDRERIKASELVRWALLGHAARFQYHEVRLVNAFENLSERDFDFKGSVRMLTAALSNLIDNALHWVVVGRTAADHPAMIWIGPSRDLEGAAILVADSGPGFTIPEEVAVEPFMSTKMDGMGLGLYFVDMAMKAHRGRLAFPERSDVEIPAACTGAVVAIVFFCEERLAA